MPLYSADALILRTYKLGEADRIVVFLTRDRGKKRGVAKGARRSNSPFRGRLDLFYLADFSYSRSRRSELHTLREVVLREMHSTLREELTHLQQASYCAALIEQAVTDGVDHLTQEHGAIEVVVAHGDLPLADDLTRVIGAGLRDTVRLGASGRIITGFDLARMRPGTDG